MKWKLRNMDNQMDAQEKVYSSVYEYEESDYLLLSGVQHYFYCPRQWALIHIEQVWQENEHTVIGRAIHERAHDSSIKEKRKDVITVRGMRVSSPIIGVSGECDVIELIKTKELTGITIHGYSGLYTVYPVEYKKGKPKSGLEDVAQLTLEAICLEYMMGAKISEGAIYYDQIKRRQVIAITDELKGKVLQAVNEMHKLMKQHHIPLSKLSKKCSKCSLWNICLPEMQKQSPRMYIYNHIGELL